MTAEDLAKILDQSTLAAKLCSNPVLVSVDELKKPVAKSQAVKVQTQEPPSIKQTTGLLLLPPPPSNIIGDSLQVLSATTGEAKGTTKQPTCSTPTSDQHEDTQAEEKDETSEKEESAIQVLVTLPKSSTP